MQTRVLDFTALHENQKNQKDLKQFWDSNKPVVFNLFYSAIQFSTQSNLITLFGKQNLNFVSKFKRSLKKKEKKLSF